MNPMERIFYFIKTHLVFAPGCIAPPRGSKQQQLVFLWAHVKGPELMQQMVHKHAFESVRADAPCKYQVKNPALLALLQPHYEKAVQKEAKVEKKRKREAKGGPKQPKPRPSSGFYGVSANMKRWCAKIGYDSKQHYLGTFDTKQEAALAYDREARQCREVKPLNYESIEAAEEAAVTASQAPEDAPAVIAARPLCSAQCVQCAQRRHVYV
jgi:hypothetical protein